MSEDRVDVFGGVDTHRDIHVAAVVDTVGRVVGSESFAADESGYGRMVAWFRPEFGGCFAFCLVRGGAVVACFHYIAGAGGWWWGLGDSGFVPGAGVCSDGGECSGL